MIKKGIKNIDVILLFALCVLIFTYLILQPSHDIAVHVKQVIRINSHQVNYPANFLFYFLINLLSGFSNGKMLYIVTVVLLSLAVVAKYLISKNVFIKLNEISNQNLKPIERYTFLSIMLGLFFCFAIPDPFSLLVLKKMYLSKFVPMVWHNSTTILLFPFAILLFWKQLKILYAVEISVKEIIVINLLVVFNILIKPSFIFAYAPITLLFICKKNAFQNIRSLLLKLTPFFTTGLIILIQYYLIFIKQDGSFYNEKSQVAISAPFETLLGFVPLWFIPFSFIFSYALVIFATIFYKEILNFTPFKYALSLTMFGIVISAFIIERGPRELHGNFLWQNVICTYLLFMTTVSFLASKLLIKATWTLKDRILGSLFFIHAISGILYLIKIVVTTSYY
jgi:hypothetical protein